MKRVVEVKSNRVKIRAELDLSGFNIVEASNAQRMLADGLMKAINNLPHVGAFLSEIEVKK